MRVQRAQIPRVHERDNGEETERKKGDDPSGHAPLGRERLDKPTELEPRTDRVGYSVEDFCRVPTRVALQRGHESDLVEVAVVNPAGDNLQRVVQWYAQLFVGHHAAELAPGGLRSVVHDHRERPDEAVAGSQCRCEDLEVVRKLFGELVSHLVDTAADEYADGERNHECRESE